MINYNFNGEFKHTIINYNYDEDNIIITITYEDYEGSNIKTNIYSNIKEIIKDNEHREIKIDDILICLDLDINNNAPTLPDYLKELLYNSIYELL